MDWQNRKQQILYTAFEQPSTIKEFTSAANTTYNQLDYVYGTHENRVMSIEFNSATPTATTTRYYIGNYERLDNGTSKRHIYYIGAAIITYDENTVTGPNANVYKTYYALTDHQGSILKVIDANGTGATTLTVAAEYNYDAWGRNRNATTWDYTNVDVTGAVPGTTPTISGLPWLTRGYTGHEHLRTFALINMNGRMYDPALGRMLSPDNYAGLDGTTQSFNRYSYVMNNPLKYTDPTGEWAVADDIAAMAIGGTLNVLFNLGSIKTPAQALGFFAVGAIAGEVALYAAAGGPIAAVAAAGAITGFGNALLTGSSKGEAGIEGVKGLIIGAFTAGLGQVTGADKFLGKIFRPLFKMDV